MNSVSFLLKCQPVTQPGAEIVKLIANYSKLFTLHYQQPSIQDLAQNHLIDAKEVLIEIPPEKQGIHPKKFENRQQKITKHAVYNIFTESGLCASDAKSWYYQDDHSKNHGPFTSIEIDSFLTKGQINMQTKLAMETLDKFVRVEKIIQVINKQKEAQKKTELPKQTGTISEPFKYSGLTKDLSDKVWYFKQPNAEINGPFSTTHMDTQWQKGAYTKDTLVGFDKTKLQKLETYLTLGEKGVKQDIQEKQKEIEKQKEENAAPEIIIDYSQIKQNINLGQWGQPLNTKLVQVSVTSAIQVKKDTKNQQKPTERKRSDNKSTHVEGNKGNLYQKKGYEKNVDNVIYEAKDESEIKEKEVQEYLKKLSKQTEKVKTDGPEKQQIQEKQKKQPQQQKQQEQKQQVDLTTKPQQQQQQQKLEQEQVKIEEPKQGEPKQEEPKHEDDGWLVVEAPTSNKKKNIHKNASKNQNVTGFLSQDVPQKPIQIPIKQKPVEQAKVVAQPKKVEEVKEKPKEVVEEEDDGWVVVSKPIRQKNKK